ncbi:hypothetical protein [Kribbella sp. NPDC051718]
MLRQAGAQVVQWELKEPRAESGGRQLPWDEIVRLALLASEG